MSLDLSKLENVRKADHGKTTARCPACAAGGGDKTGNHLVIYEDGRYGCVACLDDKTHSKEIYTLAGKGGGAGVPVRLTVQTYRAPGSKVVMDLGRFARFSVARKEQTKVVNPVVTDAGLPKRVVVVPAKLRLDEWDDVVEGEVLQEA